MALRSALINVMAAAAQKAARGLKRDFGEVEHLQVSKKGTSDFVTAADLRAEQVLKTELVKARSGFGFLMEESGETEGTDPNGRWIVDPLDGTTNFIHGIPHFAISIGLEYKGEIVAGMIYAPITDELFWAEKGRGAYLNDRRLRVSGRSRLADAVVTTGIPHAGRGDATAYLREMRVVMDQVAGVRRFGAAALDLAWVAAGRCDGYWESGLSPWDLAAGILIVSEAGGYVSDLEGGTDMLGTGGVVAANDQLHAPLLKILQPVHRLSRQGATG
jgi:myo-inositol-1(or 4)-monophosphatase